MYIHTYIHTCIHAYIYTRIQWWFHFVLDSTTALRFLALFDRMGLWIIFHIYPKDQTGFEGHQCPSMAKHRGKLSRHGLGSGGKGRRTTNQTCELAMRLGRELVKFMFFVKRSANQMEVSKMGVALNHPIFMGFSITNHPFLGTPFYGPPRIFEQPNLHGPK